MEVNGARTGSLIPIFSNNGRFNPNRVEKQQVEFFWDNGGQQSGNGVFLVIHDDREDGQGGILRVRAGRFDSQSELLRDRPECHQKQIVAGGKFDSARKVTNWRSDKYWVDTPLDMQPMLAALLKRNIPA